MTWKRLDNEEFPEIKYDHLQTAVKVKIKHGDEVINCYYRDCMNGRFMVPLFYNLESGEIYKNVEEWDYV